MQPQQLDPSEYLNQIAPQAPVSRVSNRLFLGLIAGALVLIIVATLVILTGGGASKGITPEQLALRLQTLQTTSTDAQKNIKDSQLRAINSRLTTQLAGTNRDIVEPLNAAKIDLKKVSKSLKTQEEKYTKKLSEALEDARLNDEFDSTYSREMAYELDNTTIMMKAVKKKSNSKSMKTFIDTSYDSLMSLQKELQSYVAE